MSVLASLVKSQTITTTTATIARTSTAVCARSLHQDGSEKHVRGRKHHDDASKRAIVPPPSVDERFEAVFIRSLVAAGTCRQHQFRDVCSAREQRRKFRSSYNFGSSHPERQVRRFSSKTREKQTAMAATAASSSVERDITYDDYKELVNTYPSFGFVKEREKAERARAHHFPLAPRLVLAADQESRPRHSPGEREILKAEDRWHYRQIRHFKYLVWGPLGYVSLDKLWKLWQAMRKPRPRYLDDRHLERWFRQLTWVEHKHSPGAMQRFLDVLNECTNEQISLPPQVWNSAISFVARWVRNVSSPEVKSAVEMWMRMEDAGVRADTATFNILFDVAVKSGRFALADMIFNELRIRNLPPDRYSRAGWIYYAGQKRDGDGVRQAFRDFVNSDEIVDTPIMNTVISSLLRAGESAAAENVFHKMKALHERKFGSVGPANWQKTKELGTILKNIGSQLRRERQEHEATFFGGAFSTDERKEEIQRISPIGPDAATYRILLQYHVYTSADIQRIQQLLSEMKAGQLHAHGSIYYHILCGFRIHGGFAFSSWSLKGLETLWSELITIMSRSVHEPPAADAIEARSTEDLLGTMLADEDPSSVPSMSFTRDLRNNVQSELEREPYFDAGIVIAAIRAFRHCAGRTRMLEVWDEILSHWKNITEDERALIQEVVDENASYGAIYSV